MTEPDRDQQDQARQEHRGTHVCGTQVPGFQYHGVIASGGGTCCDGTRMNSIAAHCPRKAGSRVSVPADGAGLNGRIVAKGWELDTISRLPTPLFFQINCPLTLLSAFC